MKKFFAVSAVLAVAVLLLPTVILKRENESLRKDNLLLAGSAATHIEEIGELRGELLKTKLRFLYELKGLKQDFSAGGDSDMADYFYGRLIECFPESSIPCYNRACMKSLSGDYEKAMKYLTEAVERGYTDYEWMGQDSDLESLFEREDFKALLKKCRENKESLEEEWRSVFENNDEEGGWFPDLESLLAYFDPREEVLGRSYMYLSEAKYNGRKYEFAREKAASLRKLSGWENNPRANLEMVKTYIGYGNEGDRKALDELYAGLIGEFGGNPGALAEGKYRYAEFLMDREEEEKAAGLLEETAEEYDGEWAGYALVRLAGYCEEEGERDRAYRYFDELLERFEDDEDVRKMIDTRLSHMMFTVRGLPRIETADWNGSAVNPDDYGGKILMIDFWATWCMPCLGEIPHLVKAYSRYHDKGFEIVGVSLDSGITVAELRNFCEEHHMEWRQVYDGKGFKTPAAEDYSVNAIPTAYVVDGNGRVHRVERGEELIGQVGRLIEETL